MRGSSLRRQLFALVAIAVLAGYAKRTFAQAGESTVPGDLYFAALSPFYEGEYKSALKTFQSAARNGVRTSQGRWIDSICYHTMAGECYYHMGQFPAALDRYEAALNLYLVHHTWMNRLQVPGALRPATLTGREVPTWGSYRATRFVQFPQRMMMHQGTDVERAFQQGGVVSTPKLYPVVVQEILRCTALAIRRRGELLGPYGRYDAMNARLVSTISSQTPNNWLQALHNVQLGMAQIASGKVEDGSNTLNRSLGVFGGMSHPLTGMAQLQLGKSAIASGKLDQASRFLLAASYSAAVYDQLDIVDEAFRYLGVVETAAGSPPSDVYDRAAGWANVNRFNRLQASALITSAERKLATGQARSAAGALEQAKRAMRRSDMSRGDIGGRAMYVSAMLDGGRATPESAAATATAYYRNASHWLFQIGLVERMLNGNALDGRQATSLLASVIRDPSSTDWRFNTEESMTYLLADKTKALQDWYSVAFKRKDKALMLTLADEMRRQRFLRTQPLGGRLVGLRWVLEAPKAALSKSNLDRRKEILAKYPYEPLSKRAAELKIEIAATPLQSDERQETERLKALADELEGVSAAQEVILRQIAFRREPCRLVYPPRLDIKRLQNDLNESQVVLTFLAGARSTTVFMVTRSSIKTWQLSTVLIKKHLADMLRGMGNVDRNQSISASQLADEAWKQSAAQLRTQLLGDLPDGFWDRTEEIVIIPDGFLWYLPFEALPIGEGEESISLLAKVKLRYLPLVSLAKRNQPHVGEGATTLIAGQLFPRDVEDSNAALLEEQKEAIPNTVMLTEAPLAKSSSLAAGWKRLIVIDDIDDADRDSFAWTPLQIDRGRQSSSLYDWMRLPWGTPHQVLLPGFHSAAEAAMKKSRDGDDLFLPVCGLMSQGTQTILISRWRTGGTTAMQLVREFSQELPHSSAADAWQRSVMLLAESELQREREPRLKASASSDVSETANHPFFWSGYVLVDTGGEPNP